MTIVIEKSGLCDTVAKGLDALSVTKETCGAGVLDCVTIVQVSLYFTVV